MEILVCGTSAAEGWPALFCACEPCQRARALGGKNVRSRAAYMLEDRARIDFGPDSNLHQQRYGLRYDRLDHLIISHSHDDHWFVKDLAYRRPGFSAVPEAPLHVWGNAAVERRFLEAADASWEACRIVYHRIRAWERMDLGSGLTATPVLAAHDPREECVNFRLELQGRAALIGHDTGWYLDETWERLSEIPLNILLLDCTYGREDRAKGHLGCAAVVRARDEFARRGALAPGAQVIATHFSHNGGWLHDELERYFAPHTIRVAFDGMRLTL